MLEPMTEKRFLDVDRSVHISDGVDENAALMDLLADWLFLDRENKTSLVMGRVGYAIGLFSSVFMAFLGSDFAEHFGIPPLVAYCLSCFCALPLSLLLAEQVRRVVTLLFTPPFSHENLLFAESPPSQKFKQMLLKIFCLVVALTPPIAITHFSHLQFMKVTGNLVLTTFTDVFAFFPRWVLFYWSITNLLQRGSALLARIMLRMQQKEPDKLITHLTAINTVLMHLSDNQIQLMHSSLQATSNNVDKLKSILSLPFEYRELNQSTHVFYELLISISALLVAITSSYAQVPMGSEAYSDLSKLLGTASRINDVFIKLGSWLGALVFCTLIYNAAIIAFNRFYFTGRRFFVAETQTLDSIDQHTSRNSNKRDALGIVAAAVLASLSVVPRLEVNDQEITYLNRVLLSIFNIGTGLGYWALDFWPLNDNIAKLNHWHNIRGGYQITVGKLLQNIGTFREKTRETISGIISDHAGAVSIASESDLSHGDMFSVALLTRKGQGS